MRREVDLGDRKVTVIGTAHVSEESVREVESTIEEVEPDLVGVELDEKRFESLRDKKGWRELDISEAIRDGKGYLLFLNLVLGIYQRQIGLEQDMEPGQEMLSAVELADGREIEYALIDRDISETFNRLRDEMSLREKFKLVASLFLGEEDMDIEELKQVNVLDQLVSELEKDFPSVKKVLLDERNSYMVEKLLEKDFEHAVVVVGAAHVDGIVEVLEDEVEEPEPASEPIPWMKVAKYGFPMAIVAMLVYSFYSIDFTTGLRGVQFWVISNGLLAMMGAMIARSHPVTWVASLIASPITSLYPLVAAGMVAAYVEGKIRPPSVQELEDIVYVTEYSDLWDNQAGRIILTLVLVSLGSGIAAITSAGFIASLVTGIL